MASRNVHVYYNTLAELKAASSSEETQVYCVETDQEYRYEVDGSAYTPDDKSVCITGNGENTRWLATGGKYGLLNTSEFNGLLDSGDICVQEALNTLNGHTHASSGGTSVLSDTQANRPASPESGTIFLPTDGYPISRFNGSLWKANVNGFECTKPPTPASFTTVNQTSSTLVEHGDGLLLTLNGNPTGSAYSNIVDEAYLVATPGVAYNLTVGFEMQLVYPLSQAWIGLLVMDGTNYATSKAICFRGSHCAGTYPMTSVYYYNNLQQETGGTSYKSINYWMLPKIVFMRIRDDGSTTRYFEWSENGENWREFVSQTRTTGITSPGYIGLHVGQATTVLSASIVRAQAKIHHWSLS